MAHFTVYDTDIKASAGSGDQNNGPSPYPPVKAEEVLTLQPTQTDFAEYISGSVQSEEEGTLEVQISFDYPRDHEDEAISLEDSRWVPLEQSLNEEKGGTIKVKAKESKTFVFFANAPYFRLVWTQGKPSKTAKEAIEKAETEAASAKAAREAEEKTKRELWKTEEEATTITKVEREAKEKAQTEARVKDEAEEKVAKEKRTKELAELGTNNSLHIFARAQEKGRV